MSNLAVLAAAVVPAVTIATIAYVQYRRTETSTLRRDAELARSLRDLAGDDAVRLAAVDEFETAVYERLFYARAIGPRVRAAAWALLGAVIGSAAAVLLDGEDGFVAIAVWGVAVVAAVGFLLAAVVYAVLAGYGALTIPRVSFADSYETDDETAETEAV